MIHISTETSANPPLASAAARSTGRLRGAPRPVLRIALILLAAAGAVVCLVLAQMSLPIASTEKSLSTVLCAPSETVNCDYVLSSRWARFGPISSAQLGVVYFVCVGLWFAAVGLPNRAGRAWHLVPIGVTLLGLAASIGFVVIMAVTLPVWCPWCLAAHGINAVLFLATILGWPRATSAGGGSSTAYPSTVRATITLVGCFAAFLLVLLSGITLYHQQNSRRLQLELLHAVNSVDYIVWKHRTAPLLDIPVRSDDVILGDPKAATTLVVFFDFECPACAKLHRDVESIVKRFPGVRCVLKQYPVCRECNQYVTQTVHQFSCDAARAAAAYGAVESSQEHVRAYYDRLFQSRDRFAKRPYLELSELSGVAGVAGTKAMESEAVTKRVQEDIALAHSLGVVGTPTLFLDGRRLERWTIVTMDVIPQTDGVGTLRLWEALVRDSVGRTGND